MSKLRIYLDHCAYNRPFDDKEQTSVRLDAAAVLAIQEAIRSGRLELVWSYMNTYENSANPFPDRKTSIAQWEKHAAFICGANDDILKRSTGIRQHNIKLKDSLHIACAIESACGYLITTDIPLLKQKALIKEIQIINPTEFVRIMEEN
jgi:hypothetical protein